VDASELKAIVENILLAADEPVTVEDVVGTLENGTDKAVIRATLEELSAEYRTRNLQVEEVAGGFQLRTRQEYTEWVRKYLKLDKTAKLSQPGLDTLAIIAYKQPLTRQEVEDIRGVDSSGVIKTLLEKKIIGPAGRKKVPGRPIMYRTTRKFLEYFGLKDLNDLPTLEDFKEEVLEGEGLAGATDLALQDEAALPLEENLADAAADSGEKTGVLEESESPADAEAGEITISGEDDTPADGPDRSEDGAEAATEVESKREAPSLGSPETSDQ
jgi:segregation and condensation protein B